MEFDLVTMISFGLVLLITLSCESLAGIDHGLYSIVLSLQRQGFVLRRQ
jgi:hypothetical protein